LVSDIARSVLEYAAAAQGCRVLAFEHVELLAQELGLSRREVEIAALELDVLPQRYLRNYGTLGIEGQLVLARSHVAVVGLGGLGGYVVEGLARMGVGRLSLIDGDVFFDHNLNRQLLSSEARLGKPKAHAAAERVRQINGAVDVNVYDVYASRDNLGELLAGVDVVVDALDRLPIRLTLQDVAARLDIPMVHGAIAGTMGQVMTILPGDPGLKALYGEGPVPEQGAEAELGTPAPSPMMVAAWQVHETVKLLVGKGELLRGRMLLMDALGGDVRVLAL
jgi:molybdopterin/thiamine biosynthesis adenylyltransferase